MILKISRNGFFKMKAGYQKEFQLQSWKIRTLIHSQMLRVHAKGKKNVQGGLIFFSTLFRILRLKIEPK